MRDSVSLEFFNAELYCIYTAMTRLHGDKAWDIVWLSGEILFEDVEKELNITETEPVAVLRKVGDWFARMGYVSRTDFIVIGENMLEYHLYDPLIIPAARRLIEEGSAAPHFSTSLMFAALKKKCGMGAEMIGDPTILPDRHAWEVWRLFKLEK